MAASCYSLILGSAAPWCYLALITINLSEAKNVI